MSEYGFIRRLNQQEQQRLQRLSCSTCPKECSSIGLWRALHITLPVFWNVLRVSYYSFRSRV